LQIFPILSDQLLYTTSSPTFADLTLSAPVNIYSLSHDSFADFVANEHIDWTNASQNLATTGTINTPELYNSAGDLKIMPDVQGNVVLFGDTDVADAADGKKFYIYRMAAEGDDSITMYVNSVGFSYILATDNLYIGGDSTAAGYYYSGGFGMFDDKEFNFGNGIDYTMGYVSATDTFNIVDGGSLVASIRAFLDSSGYWHFPERVRIGSSVAPTVALDVTGEAKVSEEIEQDGNLTMHTGSKVLTDGSPTGIVDIAIGTGEFLGGELMYSIYVTDGTDFQSHSGSIVFNAINKAATVSSDIEETYLPASESEVSSSGTLTDAWTITDGAGKITINCDANTSLGTPTITLKYTIFLHSTNAITEL
jgi:hypothetical protein